MRDLILHIGRQKTGSTAIQRFLHDNRELLRGHGVLVPESGLVNIAHHDLSRPLSPANLRKRGARNPGTLPVFQDLHRELAVEDGALTAVISSEAFQNCSPKVVRQVFSDYRPRIVVYLRNQPDFLASAYVQRVHATDYTGSIEDYYRDIFINSIDYLAFLAAWHKQFPEHFCVRRYQPKAIVADFRRHALGLPEADFAIRRGDSNPSLNSLVAAFKRELNRRDIDDKPHINQIYGLLPKLNDLFPAARMRVPAPIMADLLARCEKSNATVARRYFDDPVLFEDPKPAAAAGDAVASVDFDAMYAALLDLIRQRQARHRRERQAKQRAAARD